jgi:restriction system protein
LAIPDFQSVMLPVLKLLGDKKDYQSKEIKDYICKEFKLTEKEMESKTSFFKFYFINLKSE